MAIIELHEKDGMAENAKLNLIYMQFNKLLIELKQKELPHKIIETINIDIEELNSTSLIGNDLKKLFKQKQTKILKSLEKELKIVPKDHYKNLWLAVGPSAFGIPIGVALSSSFTGNIAFLAAGMPVGLLIGIILGSNMDKKAFNEGRQLGIKLEI